MQVKINKVVATLIETYQKEPNRFKDHPLEELIRERQSMAVIEQKYVNEMKEMQDEIMKTLAEKGTELTRLRGAIGYVEQKILSTNFDEFLSSEVSKNTAE